MQSEDHEHLPQRSHQNTGQNTSNYRNHIDGAKYHIQQIREDTCHRSDDNKGQRNNNHNGTERYKKQFQSIRNHFFEIFLQLCPDSGRDQDRHDRRGVTGLRIYDGNPKKRNLVVQRQQGAFHNRTGRLKSHHLRQVPSSSYLRFPMSYPQDALFHTPHHRPRLPDFRLPPDTASA